MDHVWITEYATTCGIRPKYILIHDQIHVSVRGVSSPNWGGIMTMPEKTDTEKGTRARKRKRAQGGRGHFLAKVVH